MKILRKTGSKNTTLNFNLNLAVLKKGGLTFEAEKPTSVKSKLSESKIINLDFYRTVVIVYNYELFDQIDGNIIEKAENQYRDKYFKVLNVKGDWCQVVEINWQVIENPEKKYWLKWREKGQLMIKVIEFTIE